MLNCGLSLFRGLLVTVPSYPSHGPPRRREVSKIPAAAWEPIQGGRGGSKFGVGHTTRFPRCAYQTRSIEKRALELHFLLGLAMFVRGSNPCECNVFILELELNVNCASAANLHSRCTRMKQIWSPPCARRCRPCENKWCTIARISLDKKKKGTGNAWDHNLSLGDHHGYTDPHYYFKHRHGSTEVDAVAVSLECND